MTTQLTLPLIAIAAATPPRLCSGTSRTVCTEVTLGASRDPFASPTRPSCPPSSSSTGTSCAAASCLHVVLAAYLDLCTMCVRAGTTAWPSAAGPTSTACRATSRRRPARPPACTCTPSLSAPRSTRYDDLPDLLPALPCPTCPLLEFEFDVACSHLGPSTCRASMPRRCSSPTRPPPPPHSLRSSTKAIAWIQQLTTLRSMYTL